MTNTNTNTNTNTDKDIDPMNMLTDDTPAGVSLAYIEDLAKQGIKTKSAIIRHLHQEGMETKDIAKNLLSLGMLSKASSYQHVRNVLTRIAKKG